MTPDLNSMALFVRVVDYKSFTEASRRLGVPISTVSRKISELEKHLGVRLLERSTRKLRLTEMGHEYYQCCRRGLDEFEAGSLIIAERQSEVAGTLRLSIPPNLADVLVVPIVCAFQVVYPKTVVKILVSEHNVDLIDEGIDIALRVGRLESSSMAARQLLLYRHLLVATPEYIKTHDVLTHPDELANHRIITFGGWQGPLFWELNNDKTTHKIAVEGVLSINEISGIQYAAQAHQGIANIPSIICSEALQQGALVEVMPEWRFLPTALSALYPSNRNTPRLVRLFIDFCVEHVKNAGFFTGV
ncbi:Transcriptional regulator, LysR family [hydrothermal vent metagenome]|uniref:Transcriptional regulator, LysR family n=1 Tax=hydrothermal vent metagenome TaxID=652676 RepID=A0A3B0WTW8_9ZZZZ